MNAPAVIQSAPPVAATVRDVWDTSQGDIPTATDALFNHISTTPELLNSIMPAVLRTWCRDQIERHVGAIRIAAVRTMAVNDQRGGRLRHVIAQTLFDFPLPGGKRLAEANAGDIEAGAAAYNTTAEDAAHKARWLRMVAAQVGQRNRAEEALTLPELEQLYEDARNA